MSKRKPIHSTGNNSKTPAFSSSYRNFRPTSTVQDDRGGTRPIAEPSSVGLILVTTLIHICKKSLLYDPKLKSVIYFGVIFVGSVIADVLPIPKTYFSRSNNIFNRFFIKWAWGWLLTTAGPWIIMTAYTIGCGKRSVIIKHIVRLVIATVAWMIWMNIFHFIETNYGQCLDTKDRSLQTKSKCLQAGKFWSSLDISGHSFIIIYSSLILSEEAYSLVGWEGIRDFIMNEEYNRKSSTEASNGCLRNLSDEDLDFLKKAYKALTPYLRGIFIVMTIQQIIWDVMLAATILYYHIMIEKFLGAVAAILTWYVTYYWLFRTPHLGMVLPGEGIFKYNKLTGKDRAWVQDSLNKTPKRSLSNKGPTFMGMPLRTGKEDLEKNEFKSKNNESNSMYKRSNSNRADKF